MPDIVITPNRGTTSNPKIDFTGTSAGTIKLEVLSDGTIAWNGANGSLFSIADSLSGSLMSVNDISGLPAFEVFSDNRVIVGQFGANLLLGKTTSSSNGRLQLTSHTTNTGGIGFGSDVTLFRSAADILKTEDSFHVNGEIYALASGGGLKLSASSTTGLIVALQGGGIQFRNSSNANLLTLADAGNVTVNSGTLTATQLISNIAQGTAPLVVTSSTQVSNLNAQYLNGYSSDTANTANAIVRRDGSGFINATAIQTSSGGSNGVRVHSNSGITASNNYMNFFTSQTNGWAFNTNGTGADANTVVVIDAGGDLGIGTTNPTYKFEISGAASASGVARIGSIDYTTSTVLSVAPGVVNFDAAGVVGGRLKIDSAGNVGIGETTPLTKTHIHATGLNISSGNAIKSSTMAGLTITNTQNDNSSVGIWFGTNYSHWCGISGQRTDYTTTWGTDLRFYTHEDATNDLAYTRERMRITSAGNLGIGTTSPTTKLEVNGTTTTSGAVINYPYGDSFPLQLTGTSFLKANANYYGMLIRSGDANYLSGALRIVGGSNKRVELYSYEETVGARNVVFPMGNVGVNEVNPIYKLHVSGDAYISTNLHANGTLRAGNVETASFATAFTHNVANRATDIRFPNTYINGLIEIEVTSSYSNQNSVGVVKKIFSVGANPNNTIWNSTIARVVEAHGAAADNWTIGDFAWDSVQSCYIIPVYHIVSTGNTVNINIRYFSLNAVGTPVLITTTVSAEYTATIPAAYQTRHYVYYNDRLGIGTSAPSTLFQVAGNNVGNFRLDTNGSGGHYYQAESNARLGLGRDLITSAGHISFTMAGGSPATVGSAITMPANSQLGFYTSNGSNLIERVRIDGSGNVGVNSNSPSTLLNVQGSFATRNFKVFTWSSLSANATQARRYEIARLGHDTVNWDSTGVFEVEIYLQYYSRPVKKRYMVSYGYPGGGVVKLVEYQNSSTSGYGANNFQVTLGTEVVTSGNFKYLPVYIDIRYYTIIDVRVNTNWNHSTTNSSPGAALAYINESPSPTNISDFTPDSVVWLTSDNDAVFGSNLSIYGGETLYGNLSFGYDQTAYYIKGPANGGAIRIRSNSSAATDRDVQLGKVDNSGNWSSYMTVADGGNVGIGNTNPTKKLKIGSGTTATVLGDDGIILDLGVGGQITSISSTNVQAGIATSTSFGYMGTWSNHPLYIRTNNSDKIIIESGGNIGIGVTSNIRGILHVNGSNYSESPTVNKLITVSDSANSQKYMILSYHSTPDCGVIQGLHEGTAWKPVSINPIGANVGIGTTTPSYKLDVNGDARVTGTLIVQDGTASTNVFGLTTFTKSLTVTTSWSDVGISGADLATGSYIIQVTVDNYDVSGGQYAEYYTGFMSWTAGGTNSTDVDEIVLHKAGHAPNTNWINLRTVRQLGSGAGVLKLQIIASGNTSAADNYVFKFRRMI